MHVVPADLTNPQRTAELFRQALHAGLVNDGPTNRLQFFAAAERAKRLGTNPGGFFVTILKKGLWKNIASCDEDGARRELARLPELMNPKPEPTRQGRPASRKISPQGEKTDPSTIRELVRHSLASVDARWRESVTHSAPSHLVADKSFPAERNGVKEGTRVLTG